MMEGTPVNKMRNHAVGASLTALTLAAVVLTGCASPEPDECEDRSMGVMSMVDGRSGGSGGGSRSGGGKVSKPGAGKHKPATGGGKVKPGKIKSGDFDECDD